jgi:penicillin-binding protein 1C
MQIVRMLEPKSRTYGNKLQEMFRACQLEWKYSKRELLELYLSIVPLGGNIEGMKSAALLYHQTPLERLNIAQLLDLTLIPNDPNGLQPDRNGDRLFKVRTRMGARWISEGLLSREDSVVLWRTSALTERRPLVRRAPHFAFRIKEIVGNEFEVRSTLDLRIQQTTEELLSQHLRTWKPRGVQNGAVVVLNNREHSVAAYVGSEDFNDQYACGQVDGVRALRSPGSTLKPFLFALEMERGDLTPKSRLLDTPYDAEGFQAENYDGSYSGLVYADEALQRSLNVPMVRLLKRRGTTEFLDFLGRLGIRSLQSQRRQLGLSMILGGCGVTLEELVAGYAAFPSGGVWREVSMRLGDPPARREERVFSVASAYMVSEILTGLERPDLPSNFESTLKLPAVAFKTGTSYGRRDAWCIGYTDEFTVGVWIGNPDNRGNPELVGGKVAAPLLIDIFNAIATHRQKNILPLPPAIGVRSVCAVSGLAPTVRCDHQITDLYADGLTNIRTCDICKEFLVSDDGMCSYCPSCLASHTYKVKTYCDYPPELLHFWEGIGWPCVTAPPHNHLCNRVFAGEGPAIVSPSDETIYFLVSAQQRLAFLASSRVDVKYFRWYLNDRFLGAGAPGEKLFVSIDAGEHLVTCVDDHGRSSAVHIKVKSAL